MPVAISPRPPAERRVHGISYEDVKPGKPPIPITTAPRPSSAQANLHPSLRPLNSPRSSFDGSSARTKCTEDVKRDSGYTVANSIGQDSHVTLPTDAESALSIKRVQSSRKSQSIRKSQSLPRFNGPSKQSPSSFKKFRKWSEEKALPLNTPDEPPKLPDISFPNQTSDIPSISFEDLTMPGSMEFSKRGSLLIGGKRASEFSPKPNGETTTNGRPRKAVTSTISTRTRSRNLTPDEESMSQRVRSMYEVGTDDESIVASERLSVVAHEPIEEEVIEEEPPSPDGNYLSPNNAILRRPSTNTSRRVSFIREEKELAGGIEDWQDVDNNDVDRYGFIVRQNATPSSSSLPAPEPRLHRVATSLQLASEAPRRSHSRLSRAPSTAHSIRSASDSRNKESGGSLRPGSSQSSYSTARSVSRIRSAANRLPHNRNRRYLDEAGDMLTLPPGLADFMQQQHTGGTIADAMKKKEWQREEKWRKMAKVVRPDGVGGSTRYEFDPKEPKLISRTWKGIPDRWRSTAWHSFLSASAKRQADSPSDAELIDCFNELVDQSSPDDVQIDIDVPRTISSHIMFRRRYRGGQRLLFRVLHAMSLYFPDTGYVQGMATIGATLLCYFDEEMTFVMMVRMFQLRGLDRMYKENFEGLKQAFDEFEKHWLANGSIHAKLKELNIEPTIYATRWYLTVFNYSIPFPAQLRVWDVFLLLGDPYPLTTSTPKDSNVAGKDQDDKSFHGGLDILHATAAALIDGMREILLDSDFENAMKALGSWVPIRDEDLLMRVAQAEWKIHRRKQR